MSLSCQSLLLKFTQNTLGLLLYCCLVSNGKFPILHLKSSLVETLSSSVGVDPLQCRPGKSGSFGGLKGCWGGNLSTMLSMPFLEVTPMRIGHHGGWRGDRSVLVLDLCRRGSPGQSLNLAYILLNAHVYTHLVQR